MLRRKSKGKSKHYLNINHNRDRFGILSKGSSWGWGRALMDGGGNVEQQQVTKLVAKRKRVPYKQQHRERERWQLLW